MSSQADTNQASEDEMDNIFRAIYGAGYLANQLDLELEDGEPTLEAAIGTAHKNIQSLIRTEKLKLLAEVRERVIGENDRGTITDPDSPSYGEPYESTIADKNEQRAELDKLEAEL